MPYSNVKKMSNDELMNEFDNLYNKIILVLNVEQRNKLKRLFVIEHELTKREINGTR
jgi:hypothetical protein